MKTDDLINLISQDTHKPGGLTLGIICGASGGALLAVACFFMTLGFRADISQAMETVRFLLKFAVTLSLMAAASSILLPIIRPGEKIGKRTWFFLAPFFLMVAAGAFELLTTSPDTWLRGMIGHNSLHCLTVIPALSIPAALPLFVAMRRGAPEHPGMAGLIGSLVSAGIAATLYASNCFDDSPLFVAVWYPLAISFVAIVGYLAGGRFLRW